MKTSTLRDYAPLISVIAFTAIIKALDPVNSPVIGALDPWGWTAWTRQFLATGELISFFTQTGYPPTFMYFVAALASLGTDPYEIIRLIPIATTLNVIPIYLLALNMFRSHKISALASVLTVTDRFYFMRTSIGIPEGLAHFFFGFTLLFLLRALITKRWMYRSLAAAFLTASILYYHFTFIILVPLAVVLPFAIKLRWRDTAKVLLTIIAPALLFSGVVWYFRVLPNMVGYYLGTRVFTYQVPVFERSATGLLRLILVSVGKSAAVALGELGYSMVILGFLGIAAVLILRGVREEYGVGVGFLLTYLIVLVLLTLGLRVVYNLGLAGAGDSSVYMFSWLAMPTAILASYAVVDGLNLLRVSLTTRYKGISYENLFRPLTVLLIILLCVVNLSAMNYYKAPSAVGLGILQSHYYYKTMTDQEYYALDYVRRNSPRDAIVLVVGVEEPILTYEAIVAQRRIIGIQRITIVGQNVTLSALIVYPDLHTANLTNIGMGLHGEPQHQIYLITGIRKVNLEAARTNGFPPPSKASMEALLVNTITNLGQYDMVYQNDQVSVLKVLLGELEY